MFYGLSKKFRSFINQTFKIWFTLLVFCFLAIEVSAQKSVSECSAALVAEKVPNEISFHLTPHRIFNVQENKSSFKLQFYFSYSYKVNAQLPDCEFLSDALSTAFNPKVEFMNAYEQKQLEDYKLYFYGENEVSLETKYEATFHGDFDFTLFPFDQQIFPVEIMVYYPKSELKFLPATSTLDVENLRVLDWSFVKKHTDIFSEDWGGVEYEKLVFGISLQRDGGSIGVRYFYPLALVTMMGLLAIMLPPSQVESRLTVQVGSLVAVLALLIVYDSKLPDLTYLTIADGALLFSLLVLFLSCCWSILSFSRTQVKGVSKQKK